MTSPGAVLIGFQDQGNLGLGYLSATLRCHAYPVRILDFRLGPAVILGVIQQTPPRLIGFSLIFQYFLPQFAQLAEYLRHNGVSAHFCAGGHYPTLCYEQVLQAVPALDCIVRGEGEETLLDLMECLVAGRDWHTLAGIAYRADNRCVATPARPLMADLDALPYPDRSAESMSILGKSCSPLLASRGCSRTCSFCSIRQFYTHSPGPKVRVRSPANVADEMKALYDANNTTVFLFQDDDFPIGGPHGRQWAGELTAALRAVGLHNRIIWKISCRADEVERDLLLPLREAGLYAVYLGLESGNEEGLRTLGKRVTVADNLRAVNILTELELSVAYGFMMFDPSSSFASVRANLAFLRQVVRQGMMAATFCRMLPYAGTPIAARLARAGRLRTDGERADYDFLDPRLQLCFQYLTPLIDEWSRGLAGLGCRLNWAWQEYWVLLRLFRPLAGLAAYKDALRALTHRCNNFFLDLVAESVRVHESGVGRDRLPTPYDFRSACRQFDEELLEQRNNFIARHQTAILSAAPIISGVETIRK